MTVRIHRHTHTQTLTHSYATLHVEGRRRGEGDAMQYITPKFTFIHTHTRTHSDWGVRALAMFVCALFDIH